MALPSFADRETLALPILVAAFLRYGLPPEWGAGIARQESSFIVTATNNTGGDKTRGGSHGLCQMSLLTARSLGYKGDAPGLLDPATNADLAARLCAEIVGRLKTRDLQDVAAAYNSGKPYLRAPSSTRLTYVPRVLAFATYYKARCEQQAIRLGLVPVLTIVPPPAPTEGAPTRVGQ